MDPVTTTIILESLGYGCEDGGLIFSICAHLLSCVVPLWKYGTENQKRDYLPSLCSGKSIIANGMTETTSGSDPFHMSTKAIEDGGRFRITGKKIFSTNGPVADLALIYALTDPQKGYFGGVTGFLIEQDTPGFTRGQSFEKMGLRTSPIGELIFDNVLVDMNAVLGGIGGGAVMFAYSMDWERIGIAAVHVGTMQRILEQTIQYTKTRGASGRNIGSYQAVSHKIADMKIKLDAARALVYKAASGLEKRKDVTLDASVVKVFASEALLEISRNSLQIFGGYGYMTEYGIERVVRDAMSSTIYSGTSEVQRNLIAAWLGLKS
jgi:alkylation response protein AidB-like acyl-CoA dehydrogenase